MIPGLTTKISEELIAASTQIQPRSDLIIVNNTTATTAIATIVPSFGGGFSGMAVIANRSGANISTVTTGNILRAATIPVDMSILMTYSKLLGKWIPGAIS